MGDLGEMGYKIFGLRYERRLGRRAVCLEFHAPAFAPVRMLALRRNPIGL